MNKPVKIFVEGVADAKFLSDYISYIMPGVKTGKEDIINVGGWASVCSQKEQGEGIRIQMKQNTDDGGLNLLIFDADNDFDERKRDLDEWKKKYGVDFDVFLFPNNCDTGTLEDLLVKIIPEQNKSILECWNEYERCLRSKSAGRTKPLTTPAKKTKIYGYLEALQGNSKREKEKIKERERDYTDAAHWDLKASYLTPLKEFLTALLEQHDK